MIQAAASLFFLGFSTAFGPCITHCSMLILPHIAATAKGWREGLRSILVFSLVRMAIYGVMGLFAGLLGRIFITQLLQFERWVMVGGGFFVACLGLAIVFRRKGAVDCRSGAHRSIPTNGAKGAALLGLSAGILPCLPLLGALTYIALYAQTPWQGAFYGLAFGMGKLISPLIPLGMMAAATPAILARSGRMLNCFAKLCGVVLFVIGARLMVINLL